jgi:hypothetical protein
MKEYQIEGRRVEVDDGLDGWSPGMVAFTHRRHTGVRAVVIELDSDKRFRTNMSRYGKSWRFT